MEDIVKFVGIALIVYLAFWQKDMIVFLVSGIIVITLSASWVADYTGAVIALWALAVYQILRAVLMAIESNGPSRGWSQFRGLFYKVKEGG